MLFDVRTVRIDGWSVVAVVGDIDLATLPSLRQHLDLVDGDRVALDLSGVEYLDPVGLGIVLAGSVRAQRRSASFAVVCPEGRPREILRESRVDTIVRVVPDADLLDGA